MGTWGCVGRVQKWWHWLNKPSSTYLPTFQDLRSCLFPLLLFSPPSLTLLYHFWCEMSKLQTGFTTALKNGQFIFFIILSVPLPLFLMWTAPSERAGVPWNRAPCLHRPFPEQQPFRDSHMHLSAFKVICPRCTFVLQIPTLNTLWAHLAFKCYLCDPAATLRREF